MMCFAKKRRRSALLVGLDNAGKTSMLCSVPAVRAILSHYAQMNETAKLSTMPTPGLSLQTAILDELLVIDEDPPSQTLALPPVLLIASRATRW